MHVHSLALASRKMAIAIIRMVLHFYFIDRAYSYTDWGRRCPCLDRCTPVCHATQGPTGSSSKVCACSGGYADASCNVPVTNLTSAGSGTTTSMTIPGKSWRYFMVTVSGGAPPTQAVRAHQTKQHCPSRLLLLRASFLLTPPLPSSPHRSQSPPAVTVGSSPR